MNSTISSALAHLELLFPSADPSFLLTCLDYHSRSSPLNQSSWTSAALVETVSDKLLDHSWQEYPKVAWIKTEEGGDRDGIASMDKVKRRWNSTKKDGKGKGKAVIDEEKQTRRREKEIDVTLGRNIALIRLHSMFPLVPIPQIRQLLLSLSHSFLHQSVDQLLSSSLTPRPSKPRLKFKLSTFLNQFFSPRPSTESALRPTEEEPVLRPEDLFRTKKEDQELMSKFEREFSTLVGIRSKGRDASVIEEVVIIEGGSEEGMRRRLERLRGEEEEGLGKGWWKGLFSIRRDDERVEHSPLIVDRDQETIVESNEVVECECCYTSVPSSPSTIATCTSSSPHTFCSTCLESLASTYAYGQTPLSSSLLSQTPSNLGIPCPSTSTCNSTFSLPTLRLLLPPKILTALEKRAIALTIEPALTRKQTLHFCPRCSYVEISSPPPSPFLLLVPLYSLPLSAPTILPYAVQTILGVFTLLILLPSALLISLLPSRRISTIYLSLYPTEPLSVRRESATFTQLLIASFDSPLSSTTHLALDREKLIWLKPWRVPRVALKFIEELSEGVRRRKEGECTVFKCRRTKNGRVVEDLGKRVIGIEEVKEGTEEARLEFLKSRYFSENSEEEWCGIHSCRLCSSPLNPAAPSLHRCHSSSSPTTPEESLRLALENAASEAVRRVCMKCGTSGVKDEGCNKVVCRCGQAFCWACKREIGVEGYKHFCQHFTMPGQTCQQCDKCLLYKEPDEKELVREAVQQARRKWLIEHPESADQVGDGMGVSLDLTERNRVADWVTENFDKFATKLLRLLL